MGPDPLGQRSLLPVSWQDRHQRAPEAPAAGDAVPPVADSAAPGAPEPALLIVGQRRRAAGQPPIPTMDAPQAISDVFFFSDAFSIPTVHISKHM